jgi:hypothetical protein
MEQFKIGERVRFLDDVGEGVVKRVEANGSVVVADEDGFEVAYEASGLIAVGSRQEEREKYGRQLPSVAEILSRDVSPEKRAAVERDFQARYKNAQATNQKGRGEYEEVDLHLHEITDGPDGLTDHARLELQLTHFERMLRIAITQKTPRIIFIHGVGKGVLRHQIWSRVEQFYPECQCQPADPRRYGAGATEVRIFQNAV